MKPKFRINHLSIALTSAIALAAPANAQTVDWIGGGTATAWYTSGNWNPGTASGDWLTTNIAQFNNTGSATTAGINMNTASLSIGAIEVTSARTRNLTIGNSSTTAGGTLTLNGATVNSVNNVVLRNASNSLLTLQNTQGSGNQTMDVVLANATNNVVLIEGTGGVTISSIISGTGRQLSRQGAGSGTLTLSGDNTFTGGLNFSGLGTLALQHSNAAGTGTISIATTQPSNSTVGTLTLSGDINVANNIVIDAATGRNTINSIGNGTSNTLSGNITINNTAGNFITFQNRAGNGTTFTIGGATPNSTTITASDFASTLSFRAETGTTSALGVLNSRINAPNATFNINNDGFWTINSTENVWAATTMSAGNNRIQLGANDALATGARLDMGSASSVGFVDLNGFNQTVAGLMGATTTAQIKNDSTTSDSVLTLAGLSTNRSFSGAITDGSGDRQTSLVMNSSGRTQTLAGTNTYTGDTLVQAGTLIINGSTTSNTTVASGGTLKGSGSIDGTVTVQSGGTLASGTSIESLSMGTLTLNSGSTFQYEIDRSVALGLAGDLTAITGDLNIAAGAVLTIQDLGLTGTWNLGTKLTLMSYTGAWNNGLFTYDSQTLNNGDTFILSGATWQFFYNDTVAGSNFTDDLTGSSFVTMTVIPEPTTALLGALGMLVLLRRRR